MSAADTLTKLMEGATPGPVVVNPHSAHSSYARVEYAEYSIQMRHSDAALHAYLRNNAEAIRDLIVAAENLADVLQLGQHSRLERALAKIKEQP